MILLAMSTHPPQSGSDTLPSESQPTSIGTDEVTILPPKEQSTVSNITPDAVEGQDQQSTTLLTTSDPEENLTEEQSQKVDPANPLVASPLLDQRFPVQVYTEETFGQKLSHWGPTITSFIFIFLTYFIWYNGQKLSEQQVDLQRQQTNLQVQQAQLQTERSTAELADMRSKFFNDLTATDENKKTLAEIGLAGHGLKAMGVVHLALGVEQGEIRKSGVNVVYRLFQAEMKPEGRAQLLQQLINEFDSPNEILHMGVAQSLVKIEPLLNPKERQQVIDFLQECIPPQSTCSNQEGRDTIQEAAKFVSAKDINSTLYLLAIIQCPRCGDGWLQAMLKLETAAGEMQPSQRASLRIKIEQLRREVLESLREHVSDEDLAKGTGFERFMKKGQMSIDFEEFKRKVDEEFNTLLQSLNE